MKRCSFFLMGMLAAGIVRGEPAKPREFDWGFLASRQVDVNGDLRFRALGPFFERARSPIDQRLLAVRPFYGRYRDPPAHIQFMDYLWPLGTGRLLHQDSYRRWLLAFWLNEDNQDPTSAYHLRVLPIYFQGRNREGDDYHAVFPIGGQIHNIIGLDTANFVLFPLWSSTVNGSIHGQNILWPIYHRSKGKDSSRFRIFPFYGYADKENQYHKKFILWPFWTSTRYEYEKSSGSGYILFPLWGRINLTDQKTWWVIPPLFRFTRGEKVSLTYCPWPFFQKASLPNVKKLYIWPLWGKKAVGPVKTQFAIWPLFWHDEIDRKTTVLRRWTGAPFFQSEVIFSNKYALTARQEPRPPLTGTQTNLEGEASAEPSSTIQKAQPIARYFKIWPLFAYQRQEDHRRFRVLELWPLRDSRPVERNFVPLWSLWTWTTVGDSADTEVLWGLYRRTVRAPGYARTSLFPLFTWERDRGDIPLRHWSFLKGLMEYKRQGTQKSFRLLYFIRFGAREKQP